MMQKFRVAIIGTGQITAHGHLPAVLSSDATELVGLIDVVPDRAAELADKFRVRPKIAKQIDEVADQVDGVIIATPNHTHRSVAVDCLQKGLPVLIEKPLATTVADGEQIMEAAEASGALAAVGYCTRFHENAHILGSLIAQNYFGRIHRWVYQLGVRDWAAPLTGYSFRREAAGGGVLIVNGSHFLDRMLDWFGYPTTTAYFDDSMGGPEATARVELSFQGETVSMTGLIRLSKAFRLSNGFVMDTEAGIVVLPDGAEADITFRPEERPDLVMTIRPVKPNYDPEASPFQRQLEDFVEACWNDRAPMVSVQNGLTSMRLIEALYSQRQPLEEANRHREVLPTD